MTPSIPTPQLLSPEWLAEIRNVQQVSAQPHAWLAEADETTRANLPKDDTATYYAAMAFDLLAHADAQQAFFDVRDNELCQAHDAFRHQVAEQLRGLLTGEDIMPMLPPADRTKCFLRNIQVRNAAKDLNIDL